jgi:anti-anti-sigma factor
MTQHDQGRDVMVSTLCLPDATPRRAASSVSVTREGSRTVVWLDGEHDIATVAVLVDALDIATTGGTFDVVVDLLGVTFMAAATIEVLLRAHGTLARRSRALTLRSPSATASRLLGYCGMSDAIEHHVDGVDGVDFVLALHASATT